MTHPIHRLLLLAAFAVVVAPWSLPCRGQDGPAAADLVLSADAPSKVPAATEELPPPQKVPEDRPAPFVLPPPPTIDYNNVGDSPLNSPFLDRPDAAPPGWLFNVESSVLFPHFQNEQLIGGQVTPLQLGSSPPGPGVAPSSSVGLPPGAGLPITGDLVKLPHLSLNPTVSPRFEVGYRMPQGLGEFRLSYRFLDASGSQTALFAPPATDNLGLAAQTGRLALNIVDLDWGTREFALIPNWQLRTAVGVRYATAFFDSQANFLTPMTVTGSPYGTGPFTRLSQSEMLDNWYLGVHAIGEVDRKLPVMGLSLFGRVEGAGLWGTARQTFRETFVQAPGFTEQRVVNQTAMPWLNGQVGLSYEVPRWNYSRFMLGYQFEYWWFLGRGDNDLSFGALSIQGLFLRAEFNF
jgi:hypothetical protein